MGKLIDKLTEYSQSKAYPFHMPGHKRRLECSINPYLYDITEIPGFDDLGEPEDILMDLQNRVAAVYDCKTAFILVNGSTSGVLAGISAVLKPDDYILMARNSHKSAYNAAFLRQLRVEYIIPDTDSELGISLEISAVDVENALINNPQIKAVYITSPTYEGIISDIESISRVAHKYGAVLIVDAAHGAALGIAGFGVNPINQGADIVIMSLHKTLPSPTQTAVVCVNGNFVDANKLKQFINIYNSSSPSYLLMAGIEKCIDLIEQQGGTLFKEYYMRLDNFREKCNNLKYLKLYTYDGVYDIGKIIISTVNCNINGRELAEILRTRYNIETEMSSCNYVLAMSSCMDSDEAFDMLYEALVNIDSALEYMNESNPEIIFFIEKELEAYEAENYEPAVCEFTKAEGKISGDYIYLYPPGIPWVVPGEKITSAIIEKYKWYVQNGFSIRGITDNKIQIIER